MKELTIMKFPLIALSVALWSPSLFAKVERIWMTHQSADNNQIVVSWETTQPGDSTVEFGTSPELGQSVQVAGSRTLHHVEIPIPQRDVVYHYRVKSGGQTSEINTFKGYPSKLLRIAVVANIRADAKLNFDAIRKDDPHLLLSSGDTAMQYQFATEADKEATKSHSTAIDTQADLFRSTPFMVSLGNLDRKSGRTASAWRNRATTSLPLVTLSFSPCPARNGSGPGTSQTSICDSSAWT
jgi:hypothetical protein